MENGSNGPLSEAEVLEHTQNGVGTLIMIKDPDVNVTDLEDKTNYIETKKVNGDNFTESIHSEENSYSSESDALVIDESVPKKQKRLKKKPNQKPKLTSEEDLNLNSDVVTHSNPYFNESLFELSQLHHNSHEEEDALNDDSNNESKIDKSCSKQKQKKGKGKPKPKLEYAQYLGLQPTVQFKCPKCGRAGFESLSTLQEHASQCDEENIQETLPENSCSGFKLTRKVFLCSACGTYYENWNLYMHMLEFHRRFICLYCLGMFSTLEDLCQHIQSRHNLEPGHKNTLDEFFNVYNEPCYVVCCECNKLFSEQDNFFYHNCNNRNKFKKLVKQQITPENHVTGESESVTETNKDNSDDNIVQDPESNVGIIMENSDDMVNNKDSNGLENVDIAMETSASLTQLACEDKNREGTCHERIEDEKICQESETPKEDENPDNCSNASDEEKELENNETPVVSSENLAACEKTEESSKLDTFSENLEEPSMMDDTPKEEQCEALNSDGEEKLEKDPTITDNEVVTEPVEQVETRKVPKLSLKLPKPGSYIEPDPEDSDDSEKLTMEVDHIESENENENDTETLDQEEKKELEDQEKEDDQEKEEESDHEDHMVAEEPANPEPYLQVAGSDIPIIELELEQPLDKFDPKVLLQTCLRTTMASCIYCNHARKIAVNGRQLGLHCIAEHRFSAIVNSITAEELIPESFVNRMKESLDELDSVFFNLESSVSDEATPLSHLFECFQCHFSTTVHKELYLHNRKFHSKNLLLCIMCKSNFYSYSELICHLCPGLYVLDYDLKFRCCMCVNDDLPSSFRLMVHLRKRHNICDVCLENCHTQYRLSNHVWKHKLHHFCYRCGIAYRNKPDITRHLFWKHGTESVLCKKCVQKKWPHVYHFCVPPASFACEECGLTFTKAVSVKVHKRIHTNEKKWACTFDGCEEKFISKKLMEKHERRHWEPPEEVKVDEKVVEEMKEEGKEESKPEVTKDEEEKPKPKIDILDLPALNLSESDSSDSEAETTANNEQPKQKPDLIIPDTELEPPGDLPPINILQEDKPSEPAVEEENSTSVIQHIWDNFKNYQESKHKLDNLFTEPTEKVVETPDIPVPIIEELTAETALRDHDYCVDPERKADTTLTEVKPALNESVDHDYCSLKPEGTLAEKPPIEVQSETAEVEQEKVKEQKKHNSSSSSSGSGSSSDSCGSNCSCCSSSGGSSSSSSDSSNSDSSTEEGRRKQLARRQKRKERGKKMKEEAENKVVDVVVTDAPPVVVETPIRESDLDTTESETDEEFYDEAPQKLAKKILEEKRQQLLELMGPNSVPNGTFIESTSRPPTPPAGVVEEERKKKKSKSKKRKKRKSERREQEQSMVTTNVISPDIPIPPYYQQFHQQQQLHYQQPTVAPITLTISRNSPVPTQSSVTIAPSLPSVYPKVHTEQAFSRQDSSDSSLRASKRRRVPNKFYGYSSDEDQDRVPSHGPKWRKTVSEVPQAPASPMVVPPITIKTTPQPPAPPPPQPTVEPISIRTGAHLSDFRVQRPRPRPTMPPIRLLSRGPDEKDSASDSNDSSSEEQAVLPPKPAQPQLYCYCQCPYDEVSEMIGCDATDCDIEWFHFECVGIMVPPKGQWFCPDCRKKKARRELMQNIKN